MSFISLFNECSHTPHSIFSGSFSSRRIGDEGKRSAGLGGIVATGGGDIRGAGGAQEADGGVAQRRHDLRDGPAADLGAIFIEGHVANPVGAVLDAPMVAEKREDLLCARPLGGETRHAVDPLVALLARLFEDDVAFDDEDLARPRPGAIPRQQRAQRQAAPLDAPVAQVEGLCGLRRLRQVRRRREDRRDGGAQARLVVLGHHHIVPPAVQDGRGHGTLSSAARPP